MKLFTSILLASSLFLTPAMAVSTPQAAPLNITDLIRVAPVDLAAALADATTRGDAPAVQCFQGIADYNAAHPQTTLSVSKPVGPVSAFQLARDGVKAAKAGISLIPSEINKSCGWLALDVQADVSSIVPTFLGIKF